MAVGGFGSDSGLGRVDSATEESETFAPHGTTQWNRIEYRLFPFISSNWRGEPFWPYATIVNLIAKTKHAKRRKVV